MSNERALYCASELEGSVFSPNVLQNEQVLRLKSADELRRLVAENESLRKDAGWRAIETAPKGQAILYFPAYGSLRGTPRPRLQPMMRVGHASETPNRKPTHWMPLPPPPDAAKESK